MTADRPEVSSSRSSRRFVPLFLGAQTISSPVARNVREGDGILHVGAVIFKEMIPQPMRPRVFQRKSLRGQT